MMRRGTVAVLAAAVAVSGCGGGKSDKEKIETTVHDYFVAFADSDAAKACDQLVPSAAQAIATAAHEKACPAAIAKALRQPDIKRYASRFRQAKVVSVQITGSTAKVKVAALGSSTQLPLRKAGDSWKIEGSAGADQ